MTRSSGGPGKGSEHGGNDGKRGAELPGSRRLRKLAGTSGSLAGRAYQGAIEAIFAIVIATLVGYWVDTRFGTSPRWLIVGAIVGFGAFVLRLTRMATLIEEARQEAEDAPARQTPDDRAVEAEEEHGHEEEGQEGEDRNV
jgi:F0F1-type ATP synthase assembly protein I